MMPEVYLTDADMRLRRDMGMSPLRVPERSAFALDAGVAVILDRSSLMAKKCRGKRKGR